MAKMRGPRFKQCRRLGLNVAQHPKAMNRVVKGSARDDRKLSNYGLQLLEKQRLRAYYGVMEKQFKRYVIDAFKSDELTGDRLVKLLETRLDNIVFRLGYGLSIRQARQIVVHGHILVNGKKVDRPSYMVRPSDVISLRDRSLKVSTLRDNFLSTENTLPYLSKDLDSLSGTLVRMPERLEVPIEIQDHLVIEYYSKLL